MKTIKTESIFIINQFEVPQDSEHAFIDFFSDHIKLIPHSQAIPIHVCLKLKILEIICYIYQ